MTGFDKGAVENAVIDVEGDVLLLDLAIEDVFRHRKESVDGYLTYRLTYEQVLCITHANTRAWDSVKALCKAFYGEERDTP